MSTIHSLQRQRRFRVGDVFAASRVEPMVAGWVSRVVAAGGAVPSTATQAALSTFLQAIYGSTLFCKMIFVNCLVPDSLTAALTPLIQAAGSASWTNHNFIAGDLTVNGLIGNGSSKYLDTGATPSPTLEGQLLGMSAYVHTYGGGTFLGSAVVTTYTNAVLLQVGATVAVYDCPYASGTGRVTASGLTNPTGYISANRTAVNDARIYAASSGVAHAQIGVSTTSTSLQVNALNLWAFAGNYPTNPTYSSARVSFLAFHRGLTLAESAAFYAAIQALRQNLGGGYV